MPSSLAQRVVILGASNKPERYAFKALKALIHHGHEVIPIHPALSQIEGIAVLHDLAEISVKIDTVTLYVGPAISSTLQEKLIALRPLRLIFNPGTENPELADALSAAGIAHFDACTLVLLATDSFELS
jgi:uncharacterized protein